MWVNHADVSEIIGDDDKKKDGEVYNHDDDDNDDIVSKDVDVAFADIDMVLTESFHLIHFLSLLRVEYYQDYEVDTLFNVLQNYLQKVLSTGMHLIYKLPIESWKAKEEKEKAKEEEQGVVDMDIGDDDDDDVQPVDNNQYQAKVMEMMKQLSKRENELRKMRQKGKNDTQDGQDAQFMLTSKEMVRGLRESFQQLADSKR